jgi:hypothetical protein
MLPEPVPHGSIYIWCYTQGLRQVAWEDVVIACEQVAAPIREKDRRNWEAGIRASLRLDSRPLTFSFSIDRPSRDRRELPIWDSFPSLSETGDSDTRFVPCNWENRPCVKWSQIRMGLTDACTFPGACYLAENLRGTPWMVLDFDGDHDPDDIDTGCLDVGYELMEMAPTHMLYKPSMLSFHLTYRTDREIPTFHLPHCHIDILGNNTKVSGALRYFKTKEYNQLPPASMTTDIWDRIREFSMSRRYERIRR